MSPDDVSRRPIPEAILALAAAALALILAFSVLRIWRVDLHIPMGSSGDGLMHLTMIKATSEEGWPLVTVDRLGAPDRLDFRDFPAVDPLSLLIVWVMSWLTKSPGLLINGFYLLTYPLIAISAYYVLRALGLSRAASFAAAVLYALLPYHFHRGTGHLFLSPYYLVPPAILVAYELARGAEAFGSRKHLLLAAALCIALGSASVYYAFFAAVFFAVGGILGSIERRTWKPFALAAAMIVTVLLMLVVQHLPTLVKNAREGSLNVANRAPGEAELFGLKIAQLVLPITEHRWGALANIKRRYNAAPLVNENDTASLGAFATAGFVTLLVWLLFFRRRDTVLGRLSVLNAAAVLTGTIGGLSSLFSILVSPQIRSVNRISVFIAFCSLAAAGIVFDAVTRRWKPALAGAAAFAIVVLGAADQTNRHYRHWPSNDAVEVGEWVHRIESALPRGAAVFQLPYFPFPEQGRVHELLDYEPFRVSAYSDSLRFSYGAVRGSRGDLWQRWATSRPPAELARTLALGGFDGVIVERAGFPDPAAIERALATASGSIPFVSADGRRSFVRLVELRARLARELGPQFAREVERVKHPLLAGFRGGFYGEESVGDEVWNWSQREGLLAVYNDLTIPREVTLRMSLAAADPKPSTLRIRSAFWNESVPLGEGAVRLERKLVIPPGMHLVSLRSDGKVSIAPNDPRRFVFRVFDFAMADRVILTREDGEEPSSEPMGRSFATLRMKR